MINLLVETPVKKPDSVFLSDWSRNNTYESMCSDWPFNNRAVNGSKLLTWLAHNFDATAIAKEQPRNKSAEVKCVALINSRHSRRIVTFSFSPEYGVRFDKSFLSPGAEKYSNSEVCILFYRFIGSCLGIFIWRLSASIDNMNRVVVVSVFYETKRTADEELSFAKNDWQQANR